MANQWGYSRFLGFLPDPESDTSLRHHTRPLTQSLFLFWPLFAEKITSWSQWHIFVNKVHSALVPHSRLWPGAYNYHLCLSLLCLHRNSTIIFFLWRSHLLTWLRFSQHCFLCLEHFVSQLIPLILRIQLKRHFAFCNTWINVAPAAKSRLGAQATPPMIPCLFNFRFREGRGCVGPRPHYFLSDSPCLANDTRLTDTCNMNEWILPFKKWVGSRGKAAGTEQVWNP